LTVDAAALTDTMGLGANFYGNMIETNRTNQKQIIIIGIEDERSQFNFFRLASNLFKQLLHLGQYQSLIRNLVVRDLKVRYRNSVLGVLWSLMNPLLMMLVFTVVFTVMAPVRSASVEFLFSSCAASCPGTSLPLQLLAQLSVLWLMRH
jgi:hypothetical protein